MSKKYKSKAEKYSDNEDFMGDLETVIQVNEENAHINTQLKAIECRSIKIQRNQRALALSQKDISSTGTLISDSSDPCHAQKLAEFESLELTAKNIKENELQNPISVYIDKGSYYLKAGQRRLLASTIAGKKTILARVYDEVPNDYDLEIFQWTENFHREDLSTRDTVAAVMAIATLWEKRNDSKITPSGLAFTLNCSNSQATKYFALLEAPEDVLEAIRGGQLTSLKKAYELTKITDVKKRKELMQKIIDGEITQDMIISLTSQDKKELTKSVETKSSRGRAFVKANLGSTGSVGVVKTLIDVVLSNSHYKALKPIMGKIEISDFKSATAAFKKLIAEMEKLENA